MDNILRHCVTCFLQGCSDVLHSLIFNFCGVQLPNVPEGWSLTEVEGNSKVSLTREIGDEVVQVDFIAREYVSHFLVITTIMCYPRGRAGVARSPDTGADI